MELGKFWINNFYFLRFYDKIALKNENVIMSVQNSLIKSKIFCEGNASIF